MGILHSDTGNKSEYDPEQGYVPRKIREVDTNYHESEFAYIVGDGKVLKFDTNKWSLHQVKVSPKLLRILVKP